MAIFKIRFSHIDDSEDVYIFSNCHLLNCKDIARILNFATYFKLQSQNGFKICILHMAVYS